MKKRILLFTAVAGMCYLVFSSHSGGPAASGKYDCTGAETGLSNPNGCSTGASCHATSATAGVTVAVELDSAGVATTHYRHGITYTVKLTGTNSTTSTFTGFGLQMGCIRGTSAVTTPTNAGTWATTGLPAGTQYTAASASFYVVNVVEHSMKLAPTTGTGAPASTIVKSFSWTAPAAGTGPISFWAAVNCMDATVGADAGDLWNTNHVTINEWQSYLGVENNLNDINISAFPNPATTNLNLQLDNAQPGSYNLHIFNMNGSVIASQNIEVNNSIAYADINTSNWSSGLYNVVLEKDGNSKSLMVVKQ